MAVHTFYNPDLVGQLAACGITARQRPSSPARAGFVVEGRRAPARAREAVTNVIAVHGSVRITGERTLPAARPAIAALPAGAPFPAVTITPGPQTALELVDECTRLRRDNQRLTAEVDRLRAEVLRLSGGPRSDAPQNLDDSAARFAMLELD